jgi:large subunit ribosomal protein L28
MAKCALTGKKRLVIMAVSHAHNRTKKVQHPNIQKKRCYIPEEDRWVTLKVSTRAIRTIDRIGLLAYARKLGVDLDKIAG